MSWRAPAARALASGTQAMDLTIAGAGDPTWGIEELGVKLEAPFAKMAAVLLKNGIREVHGSIRFVSSSTRWDSDELPPGWYERDLMTCDGALPHAFNLALNCATLVVGDLAHARWSQVGVPTPVRLALVPGLKTRLRAERDGRGYVITGTWKQGAAPVRLALPIRDTSEWARRLMLRALSKAKIRVIPGIPSPTRARAGRRKIRGASVSAASRDPQASSQTQPQSDRTGSHDRDGRGREPAGLRQRPIAGRRCA
jgi:D-alanyl-D-alanine carboxypeptidase